MTAIISSYNDSNFTVRITYTSPDLKKSFGDEQKTVEFDILADTRKEAKELAISKGNEKSWNCRYSIYEIEITGPTA